MSDPLSFTQPACGDGDTALWAFDSIDIDRTCTTGADFALGVFHAPQVKTRQRITGKMFLLLWRAYHGSRTVTFWYRNAHSFTALLALNDFPGRLIGHIQNCFARLAANFDGHEQSRGMSGRGQSVSADRNLTDPQNRTTYYVRRSVANSFLRFADRTKSIPDGLYFAGKVCSLFESHVKRQNHQHWFIRDLPQHGKMTQGRTSRFRQQRG